MRHLLIPAPAHERVAEALAELDHETEVLLWCADAVRDTAGNTVVSPKPEAAWLSIDLFFTGEVMKFVDYIVELGTVRWVQGPLAGVDAPPFRKLIDAGIRLSNSDAPNIGVAEYVMSALLSHRHGIGERLDNQRAKRWEQKPWPEIGGQRWIIVGFGSIGHEIAKRARPFGVHVVGVRRTATNDPAADEMVTMANLSRALGSGDVVILACPLTTETRGLVNADFLAAMRSDAVLVNVSRGAVIDDGALIDALDDGAIGAAILDVFDPEPLPEHSPLWEHEKVTVTSHIAGAGDGFLSRNDKLFVEQLDAYLSARPLRREVK